MKYSVTMPSLGADMDQGKLMVWKIKPGDKVKKGQTIATVETTKSAVEIESFRNGEVLELVGKEGEEFHVGSTIAIFDIEGDGDQKKGLATPPLMVSPFVNLREAISRAMSRSKKEIPHYYLKTRVSLDALMEWIDTQNKGLPPTQRLMVPSVLMKGIIQAIQKFPMMNGYYRDGEFKKENTINLGIAVSLKSGGVLVPAILGAHEMTLESLNHSVQDIILRTRKSQLKNRELTEGTITVTNLGDLGSDEVYGIIFPPQVALIGLGRIRKSVIEDNGLIRSGFVIDMTLSADHRVTDGLLGSRFLSEIEKILLNPKMLEEKDGSFVSQIPVERDLSRDSPGDRV
jgi:pyruvate dehydrogenase E2 component (dihydrolipoamide acetyltransferase)